MNVFIENVYARVFLIDFFKMKVSSTTYSKPLTIERLLKYSFRGQLGRFDSSFLTKWKNFPYKFTL